MGPGWETRGWKAPGPSWERPENRFSPLSTRFPTGTWDPGISPISHILPVPLSKVAAGCPSSLEVPVVGRFSFLDANVPTLGKLTSHPTALQRFSIQRYGSPTSSRIPPPSGDVSYACIPSLSCLVQVQHASRNSEEGCAQRPKRGEHSLARPKMRAFYPLRSLHLAGR
jgi:hypothetical protein